MKGISTSSTAEWDQRQLYNKRLHDLLQSADINSIRDNYDDWFDCLRGVRRMIYAFLTEEEQKNLDGVMLNAQKWSKTSTVANPDVIQENLDKFHTLLYELAHKYKLLIPMAEGQGTGTGI